MGLAPMLIQQIFSIITEINAAGHHRAARRAERRAGAQAAPTSAHILETGEIVRSGTGAELAADDSVKAAYLGGDV